MPASSSEFALCSHRCRTSDRPWTPGQSRILQDSRSSLCRFVQPCRCWRSSLAGPRMVTSAYRYSRVPVFTWHSWPRLLSRPRRPQCRTGDSARTSSPSSTRHDALCRIQVSRRRPRSAFGRFSETSRSFSRWDLCYPSFYSRCRRGSECWQSPSGHRFRLRCCSSRGDGSEAFDGATSTMCFSMCSARWSGTQCGGYWLDVEEPRSRATCPLSTTDFSDSACRVCGRITRCSMSPRGGCSLIIESACAKKQILFFHTDAMSVGSF